MSSTSQTDEKLRDPTTGRYYEDLKIGTSIDVPGEFALSVPSILAFAETYDPQPTHLDEEAAKALPFGRLTASGWQSLCATMRLMVEARPFGSLPIVGAGVELKWLQPVYPGDVLKAEATVIELLQIKSKGDRGLVRMKVETRNQLGVTVLSQIWTMVLPKRPKSPASYQ